MATERYIQPEAFAFETESEAFGEFKSSEFGSGEFGFGELGLGELGLGEQEAAFAESGLSEAELGAAEFGQGELGLGEFGAAEFNEGEFAFVGETSTPTAAPARTVTCPPPSTRDTCLPPGTRPNHILDNFAFDRSDVTLGCHMLLINEAASRIVQTQTSRQPIRSVLLMGHTDKVGPDAYNVELGRRRAQAVLRELCMALEARQRGIARTITFHVGSCGEAQPKATRQLSRRVEIFLPRPPQPRGCPPFQERIRLHLKILVQPRRFTIARMLQSMRQVYEPKGFLVEVVSCEVIKSRRLEVLDIHCPGRRTICCPFPCATRLLNREHVDLFRNQHHVRTNELAVYFVRRTLPGLNGCCAHPVGRPGVIVTAQASQWTLAHEIGHVLGLPHVLVNTRLMIDGSLGGTNALVTPPLPVLTNSEVSTMMRSALTLPC
jgi:outer membrane protein OmpA-like peptidoglycan-associated protein